MKLAIAFVLLAACGGSDKPAPAAPVANQAPAPAPAPAPATKSDDERVRDAERAADEAKKEAQEAMERVQKLENDIADLDSRVTKAIDMIVAAQTDADRSSAKAKLEQLRAEKADMEARIAAAKAAAAKAERRKGVKVSKECMDNPLAKGCS